jgi:CTP synthase (UTP-ammonia lyase)
VTREGVRIGLVGDRDGSVPAHRAIPEALRLAAEALAVPVAFEWVPTESIEDGARIAGFDGLWCVPASPYRSMDGALRAIELARVRRRPFLGTCGGFQHAIVEYARNVLGWADADHAETTPAAARPVIAPLECALVEVTGTLRLRAGSRIARAYGREEATEGYRCRYGLNRQFQAALLAGPLRIGAEDAAGEVRAVELDGHPFFVATLFQPERAALEGRLPPLVAEFIRACAACRTGPVRRETASGNPMDAADPRAVSIPSSEDGRKGP